MLVLLGEQDLREADVPTDQGDGNTSQMVWVCWASGQKEKRRGREGGGEKEGQEEVRGREEWEEEGGRRGEEGGEGGEQCPTPGKRVSGAGASSPHCKPCPAGRPAWPGSVVWPA